MNGARVNCLEQRTDCAPSNKRHEPKYTRIIWHVAAHEKQNKHAQLLSHTPVLYGSDDRIDNFCKSYSASRIDDYMICSAETRYVELCDNVSPNTIQIYEISALSLFISCIHTHTKSTNRRCLVIHYTRTITSPEKST